MATTQMNVRIEEDTKVAGDAVFEKLGYTPTQVVRIVWQYAGLHAGNSDVLGKLLDDASRAIEPAESEERQRLADGLAQGPQIYKHYLSSLGVQSLPPSGLSEEELLEEAYLERMRERGLA